MVGPIEIVWATLGVVVWLAPVIFVVHIALRIVRVLEGIRAAVERLASARTERGA